MGSASSLLYTPESFALLFWVLAGLLAIIGTLLGWFALDLHGQVINLPEQIAKKVDALHTTIREDLSAMRVDLGAMRESQQQLERDIRSDFSHIDRRVTRLEVISGVDIGTPRRRDTNDH
jgi:hypothetical protein